MPQPDLPTSEMRIETSFSPPNSAGDRRTDLPDLSARYPLTPDHIEAFQRDGHVLLRGVCSCEEVAFYRRAIIEASQCLDWPVQPFDERDTYGKAFLQRQNLRLIDARVRAFALAERFARIAAELMDVDGVRIYHDQSLFKEPGGGRNLTPWHQDLYYWPLSTASACGLWMPLVDVEPEMGGMMFASGSHRLGSLGQLPISDASQVEFERAIHELDLPVSRVERMRAGDATFHMGWTLHAAAGNSSEQVREAMIVTYFGDGTRIARPTNAAQEHDRNCFLGGRQPGEIADSDLNPLVYRRQDASSISTATTRRT